MKRLLFLLCLCLSGLGMMRAQEPTAPLLRLAMLSDVHNELDMISDASTLRLRPTMLRTLDSLQRAGGVDVLIMGGDYTSDCTTSQANWQVIRQMMADATRSVFPADAKQKPVLWVTGNHDYEVANYDELPKPYNAADFYTFPMKDDVGTLDPAECFYETADNGSAEPMSLLAAYHYVLHGFDFVVLNCGKYFFKSAWDYQYSAESVAWVDAKLDELTSDDPDRTIIFVVHLPLPSSIGATSGKTMSAGATSSRALERALAKHPGIICLYGHDHSSTANKSYYERSILQRFTCYDTNANIIDPYGEEVGPAPDPEPAEAPHTLATLRSVKSGTYLGYNTYNAATVAEPNTFEIYPSTDIAHGCVIYSPKATSDNTGVQHYIYCGSSGRFSGNTALGANSTHYFFEVADPTTGVGKLVDVPEVGKTYAIVTLSSKGGYYALSDEVYKGESSSQRIVGVAAANPTANATQTFTADNVLWQMAAADVAPDAWQDIEVCVQNVADGTFLGYDSYNIATLAEQALFTLAQSAQVDGSFALSSGGRYVHCGSSGRFSGNTALSKNSSLLFYEVDPATLEGTLATLPCVGKTYAIVALSSSGGYYALTNQGYSVGGSGQRLSGSKCTNDATQTFASATALWTLCEQQITPGAPSFMSVFAGSMRFNSLETNASPGTADPRIVQSLVMELYADSVVFTIQNMGETGTLTGAAVTARITDPLRQYVVRRPVRGAAESGDTPDCISATRPSRAAQRIYSISGTDMGSANATLPRGVYIVGGRKMVK